MFTIIITLLLPLVSLGIWRQYVLKNNGSTGKTVTGSKGAYVLRYATCLMIMLFVPWVLLSLISNDDNTILRKLVESREYAVKVLILEICIMLAYTICELFVEEAKAGKHEKIHSVMTKIAGSKGWNIVYRYIGPVVVLAFSVLVICLNFGMMSDRVLWGDEAFSANTRDRQPGHRLENTIIVLRGYPLHRRCGGAFSGTRSRTARRPPSAAQRSQRYQDRSGVRPRRAIMESPHRLRRKRIFHAGG